MTVRSTILGVLALLWLAAPAQAQTQRLANYFFCTLEDGRTRQDLTAFMADYEKAVAKAGLEGYELRVLFPIYAEDIRGDRFVWEGSWANFEEMAKISAWFRASAWPAKFDEIMSCERSSLWNVVD